MSGSLEQRRLTAATGSSRGRSRSVDRKQPHGCDPAMVASGYRHQVVTASGSAYNAKIGNVAIIQIIAQSDSNREERATC